MSSGNTAARTSLAMPAMSTPRVWLPFCIVSLLAIALFILGLYLGTQNGINFFDVCSKGAQLLILFSGLLSVLLLRRQNAETKQKQLRELHYNRVETFYKFFGDSAEKTTHDQFVKFLNDAGLDSHFNGPGVEISDHQVIEKILGNPTWDDAVRGYLDRFESLAAAVHSGFVDDDYTFCLQGGRIVRAAKVLAKLIDHYRAGNEKAYVELLDLAATWQERRSNGAPRPQGQVRKNQFG